MAISNQQLLRKASMTLSDFGGQGEAPLPIQQATAFIRMAMVNQALLPMVRTVTNGANKWQEYTIDFASRIMKPGAEFTRLVDGDRTKPTTGYIEMSTVLLRGEVPVSDEVLEDNLEGQGFSDTLMSLIADASGRDIEELMLMGATNSGDPYLAQLDGWLRQMMTGSGAHTVDATNIGTDYQTIFRKLLVSIPNKYKRDPSNWRFFVPSVLVELYRDALSKRGTPMGDIMLTGDGELRYQAIPIVGIPLLGVTAGSPDTTSIILSHRLNMYAGWRRRVRFESFRDPREGGTSFLVTTRIDAKVANVEATAVAYNVNVEP